MLRAFSLLAILASCAFVPPLSAEVITLESADGSREIRVEFVAFDPESEILRYRREGDSRELEADFVHFSESSKALLLELHEKAAATKVESEDEIVRKVSLEGTKYTVSFYPVPLRTDGCKVLLGREENSFEVYEYSGCRTYFGRVLEDPTAMAAGYLRDDGTMRFRIYFDRSESLVEFHDSELIKVDGTLAGQIRYYNTNPFDIQTVMPESIPTTCFASDIGIDMSHKVFGGRRIGGDIKYAMELIEFSMIQSAAAFVRDLKTLPRISTIVLRTSESACPYASIEGGERTILRAVWKEHLEEEKVAKYDKLLVIFPGGSTASRGGTTAATTFGFFSSPSFDPVGTHELAHTYGAADEPGNMPEGGTIMGGNKNLRRFCGPTVEIIFREHLKNLKRAERRTPMVYDTGENFSDGPVPPYAAFDQATVIDGEERDLELDVLANDFDANGETVSLIQVDEISARGGSLKLVRSMAKDERSRIVYRAPADLRGPDFFNYRIEDESGQQATGLVAIEMDLPGERFEAEFEDTDGQIENRAGDGLPYNSGEGYVNLEANEKVEWAIRVDDEGEYSLRIGYSNVRSLGTGIEEAPYLIPARVVVNDVEVEGVPPFVHASSLGERWNEVVIPKYFLKKGLNKINVEPLASIISIDYLDIHQEVDMKFNFQNPNDEEARGALSFGSVRDFGNVFGKQIGGAEYGWNQDCRAKTAQRHVTVSRRLDYQTGIYMDRGENDLWEVALPNGRYGVFVVCGNPPILKGLRTEIDVVNNLVVEGVELKDPERGDYYDEYDLTVEVKDGRLSVELGTGAKNVKLCMLRVHSLP